MSFSRTSRDIRLEGSNILSALCNWKDKSSSERSQIDLDQFIGNIDGSFKWGDKSFSHSSSNISLNGSILRGSLRKIDGQMRRSSIDLDEHIANVGGVLTYVPEGEKTPEETPTNPPSALSTRALDSMWNSSAMSNADSRALPPPYHLEDALSQLRITLLPKTQRKAVHVIEGSQLVEPTLALYCPVEGGEYVIDATVKDLAEKTNSEVQVIDMAQVAAGEWGSFAAAEFRLKNNPLGKVKPNEDLNDDDNGKKNTKALGLFWRLLVESNPPAPATSSTTEPAANSEDTLAAPSASSKPRPRIIYIRDFGLLSSRNSTWFPPLYSAIRARRMGGRGPKSPIANPTTIIFGISPSISSILTEGGGPGYSRSTRSSCSRAMGFLFSVSRGECNCRSCRPSSVNEWDEDATKERAKRLKSLKDKWEKGDLLKDLPKFRPKVTITKDELGKENGPVVEESKEELAVEVKDETKTEKDETPVEGTTGPKGESNVEVEDEKKGDQARETPQDPEGVSDDSDSDYKQELDGYFRSCIITPAKQNAKLERTSRENRRRELNELMLRMTVGVKGGQIESGAAPVPVKEESEEEKPEDKNKKNDDQDMKDKGDLFTGWDERLLDSSALKGVVERALEISMLSSEEEEEGPVSITWAQLQDAWHASKRSDEGRKAWAEADDDSSDKDENEEKPPVDEVIEKVKSADLDEYERRLLGCIVDVVKLSTTFENVHLPEQIIDNVRSIVSLPLLFPDAFKSGILKQQAISGALLFGPPGTGKTLVVRALAKESGARMLAIKPSDIADKWVGETEKLVRSLFKLARRLKPCVVFIDEIDSLMGSRQGGSGSGSSRWHTSMLTEFMQEMDGLMASSVIVIGATNRPFDIDDAVLRRLPCRLLVDLPGVEAREEILRIMLRDDELAPDVSISDLAKKTDRFSGSDLKNLCVAAAMDALKESVKLPWLTKKEDSKDIVGAKSEDTFKSKHAAKETIELEKSTTKSDDSDDGPFNPNSEAPSAPSTGATTPEEKAELQKPRVLGARHFLRALMDVAPSSSESQGSLSELRKWNTQFGTGERDRPRATGSSPYSYNGAKSSATSSSGVPGANGISNYSSTGPGSSSFGSGGLGSTGLGSSHLGSSSLGATGLGSSGYGASGLGSSGLGFSSLGSAGLGSAGLGSSGLGPTGVGSRGFGSASSGSLGASGLGFSGLSSLSGTGGAGSNAAGTSGYTPSTYTPPGLGGTSTEYVPKFPGYSRNIPGYTSSTPDGGSSAPGS
ncbi:hypothetical protein FRC09_018974 [Ceratobasidium sp. 395]|nr:hypothetical protein FRC09_018974 [Ceratobasidium sp. 395]